MASVLGVFIDVITLLVTCSILWLKNLFKLLCNYLQPSYKDISDDTILITGAANGLGRLMCLEFARYCKNIGALDCNSLGLLETARLVKETTGHNIKTYECDLRDKCSIDEAVKRVLGDFDRITILVNNAGIVNADEYMDLSAEKIRSCFEVNVFSHFFLTQAFLPGMLGKSGNLFSITNPTYETLKTQGHIVTIASVAGDIPCPGLSDYCASKAAALLACEALELELDNQGLSDQIIITRILPFLMDTQMFKGCDTRNKWLFPIVSSEYCAKRVVEAVRSNERVVYVTNRFSLLKLLKCLVSPNILFHMYKFGGSNMLAEQLRFARR